MSNLKEGKYRGLITSLTCQFYDSKTVQGRKHMMLGGSALLQECQFVKGAKYAQIEGTPVRVSIGLNSFPSNAQELRYAGLITPDIADADPIVKQWLDYIKKSPRVGVFTRQAREAFVAMGILNDADDEIPRNILELLNQPDGLGESVMQFYCKMSKGSEKYAPELQVTDIKQVYEKPERTEDDIRSDAQEAEALINATMGAPRIKRKP